MRFPIRPKETEEPSFYSLDCSVEEQSLTKFLLQGFPCYVEHFQCEKCGNVKINNHIEALVNDKEFFDLDASKYVLSRLLYGREHAFCLSCKKNSTAKCENRGKKHHTRATDTCKLCSVKPSCKHSIEEIGKYNAVTRI